jgi:hypothetical protein
MSAGEVFDVLSMLERGGRFDRIPVLLCKWIGSLLESLLAFRKALVLAYGHDCDECGCIVVAVVGVGDLTSRDWWSCEFLRV